MIPPTYLSHFSTINLLYKRIIIINLITSLSAPANPLASSLSSPYITHHLLPDKHLYQLIQHPQDPIHPHYLIHLQLLVPHQVPIQFLHHFLIQHPKLQLLHVHEIVLLLHLLLAHAYHQP